MLRYAARFLRNEEEAQDVVQEAFIRLWRACEAGQCDPEKVEAWLYRVTHNLAVDHIRHEDRLHRLHEQAGGVDLVPGPDRKPAGVEERQALVMQYVHRLDPAERQVLVLRLQEGRSYQEISEITGRTEGNVGCILHHATKKMAAVLRRAGLT